MGRQGFPDAAGPHHETIGSAPLLLLVTYRESDLDRDHPMTDILADLRRVEGVQRIALDGLGSDEVAEVLTAAAGHDIEHVGMELAAEIAHETDGNPFFVGEILAHLTESGALEQDDAGRWRLTTTISELGLPPSVRDVVSRRVERLGDDIRQILTTASVIGRSFDLDLLTLLVPALEDESSTLDTAAGIIGGDRVTRARGSFQLRARVDQPHPLRELSATRRARMHRGSPNPRRALWR